MEVDVHGGMMHKGCVAHGGMMHMEGVAYGVQGWTERIYLFHRCFSGSLSRMATAGATRRRK